MIELGLKRIARLVPHPASLPWKAIHVAGTNGKVMSHRWRYECNDDTGWTSGGSVCAYIASCLQASGIRTGRFNSPHLIDRWDCINLDGVPVPEDEFLTAEAAVKETNQRLGLGASEFELLTATAFEIFSRAKVHVGVIEVGLGGRLDATNVIENPLATVITKIGLDHQGLLGNTLEEIAREKAGILKAGSACVVDGSNPKSVLEAVRSVAAKIGAGSVIVSRPAEVDRGYCDVDTPQFGRLRFTKYLNGGYQPDNLACAVNVMASLASHFPSITSKTIEQGVADTKWPGRLEFLELSGLTGGEHRALVDGAHNPQAARELAKYVNETLRSNSSPIIWVLAASKGKDVSEILALLLRPEDQVIATDFGPVDGMPWVTPTDKEEIIELASKLVGLERSFSATQGHGVGEAIKLAAAAQEYGQGEIVVAGSLYLIADLMRALREANKRKAV